MPLFDVKWAEGGRDFRSFSHQWANGLLAAIHGQLTTTEGRCRVEMACQSRHDTAKALPTFDPPPGAIVVPARLADWVSVKLTDTANDQHTVAAVVLASEENKADSDGALAFAVRIAALAATGASIVVVDVAPGTPSWATHLHSLIGVYPIARRPRGPGASVLVLQPRFRNLAEQYEVAYHMVALGGTFPTVALPVQGVPNLTIDLEATYSEACEHSRIA